MDSINFARIRVAVAEALGLPPAALTDDQQVAEALERIIRAARQQGVSFANLGRDLDIIQGEAATE